MPNFTGLWTPAQQIQAKGLGIWPATPGAPTSVTATAGNASASVAFTAPTDTGYPANAITSYTVTSSPGSFTATGAASPLTVVGLTNGTSYTFTVRATNSAGSGPASSASSSVTPVPPNYIDDAFSTYLYTGNGSTQTITNGINLSSNGGLVWIKRRNNAYSNVLYDTSRGVNLSLSSNTTAAQVNQAPDGVSAFNTTGFSLNGNSHLDNNTTGTYASWTFRKQAKFFDVVTYTGDGVSGKAISHNLGSTPGCVIIKRTDSTGPWLVHHRGTAGGVSSQRLYLNTTASTVSSGINASATTITVYNSLSEDNIVGATYVAYLFAHNAGGFGESGNDNVISCGSYTGAGANLNIDLGYEPQWLLIKSTSNAVNWVMFDNMRGMVQSGNSRDLRPNLTDSEGDNTAISITSTGFIAKTGIDGQVNANGYSYIYIAIRRPMKPPTVGTSVFEPVTRTTNNDVFGTLEAADMGWFRDRTTATNWFVSDRVRGLTIGYYNPTLYLNTTAGETTPSTGDNVTAQYSSYPGNGKIAFGGAGVAADYPLGYSFKRAPTFFDIVCYTPTDSGYADLIYHNLGVAPEMIIAKNRGATATQWYIHHTGLGASEEIYFNSNQKSAGSLWTRTSTYWNNSSALYPLNEPHVAYLFATCPGVSKVGSYTGNGSNQTINCGFAAGARFVMIKRTNTTGDWYVWDTARGIISGMDPYLRITTDVEVTNDDSIDPDSSGFIVNQVAATNINVTSSTYIFLAIA